MASAKLAFELATVGAYTGRCSEGERRIIAANWRERGESSFSRRQYGFTRQSALIVVVVASFPARRHSRGMRTAEEKLARKRKRSRSHGRI